ncbi:DUF397 domain-containing protein [Streptomyces sp. DSM 44917]|uniref:DUF397 domain-containing protein n=1 Tax=Streptomyces boetiae TaxID=3075541 RepID=A0ABU2L5W2_9ACTN|nr:DUF397 domain-containing protein [Streptomyces sp. DSM 44917]MDT0306947.1 DUF397 domain-containing protein [Streptomyces sp. DSM 44917]
MSRIPDASALSNWRKSTYSDNPHGGCIEVSDGYPSAVPVRDSKAPHGPAVLFPIGSWSSFVTAVKRADLPRG